MPTPPATDPHPSRSRAGAVSRRGRPVTAGQAARDAALQAFRTPVRGYAFASRPPEAAEPVPGQPARLVREPANPADPLAVAVWVEVDGRPWRIGYLDRGVSARVAPRLDHGTRIEARIDGWAPEPDGRWRRPVLVLLPEPPPDAGTVRATAASQRTQPGADTRPAATPDRVVREPETDARAEAGRQQQDAATPSLWGRPPGVTRRRLPARARPPRPG